MEKYLINILLCGLLYGVLFIGSLFFMSFVGVLMNKDLNHFVSWGLKGAFNLSTALYFFYSAYFRLKKLL